MLLKRLAYNIRKQDWFIVIIELLVVIVGLMMAFQVDRWWEAIGEKKLERVYIQRLIDDIESDIPKLEGAIQFANMRKDYAERLRNNPELVHWLTQLRAMQMEQLGVHKTRIELANAVLDSLKNYSEPK